MPFCFCLAPGAIVEDAAPSKASSKHGEDPVVRSTTETLQQPQPKVNTEVCMLTQDSDSTSQQSHVATAPALAVPSHSLAKPPLQQLPESYTNTPDGPQRTPYEEDACAIPLPNRHPAEGLSDPLAGQTRYKKLRDLGSGTYGFVVLAHDTKQGDYCAIKFLERGKTLGKMVEREILSHRLCSAHPHIVGFREVFLTPRYLAIAMEFAAGGDLFEYTLQSDGHVSENEARRIFQQLISAVAFCHANGVVNRDIKLENALLLEAGPLPNLKLCDFGYSKNEHVDSACKTAAGTPEYVAPEMVLTQGNYNGKPADVWSCGIFLYVMLNGAYPFHTEPGDKLAIKRMVKGIYKFHVDVSPACADLVSRMLIPNPQDRITMVEILRHPWYLRNLNPGLAGINRRLVGQLPKSIQSEEEIRQVVQQAQTIEMPQ